MAPIRLLELLIRCVHWQGLPNVCGHSLMFRDYTLL